MIVRKELEAGDTAIVCDTDDSNGIEKDSESALL
jgi:hypothetical protein